MKSQRKQSYQFFPGRFDELPSLEEEQSQKYFHSSNEAMQQAAKNVKNIIENHLQVKCAPDEPKEFDESSLDERKKTDERQTTIFTTISDLDLKSREGDVYDVSVAIYRKLRNEIPFLTDAAHDIDAACEAAKSKENGEVPIELGPLVKRAPPGRGRRKQLSVVNTPLPAQILKMHQKQRAQSNQLGDPYQAFSLHRPLRILFVDDSLVTLKMTAQRLRRSGMVVDYTTNGSDAIDRVMDPDSPPYDIFLADLHMPQMNGAEIARIIRRKEMELKANGVVKRQFLVGVSSDTDKKNTSLAISSGMDVFLGKPFTPADIMLFVTVPDTGTTSGSMKRSTSSSSIGSNSSRTSSRCKRSHSSATLNECKTSHSGEIKRTKSNNSLHNDKRKPFAWESDIEGLPEHEKGSIQKSGGEMGEGGMDAAYLSCFDDFMLPLDGNPSDNFDRAGGAGMRAFAWPAPADQDQDQEPPRSRRDS